jgi:hypothetical protein
MGSVCSLERRRPALFNIMELLVSCLPPLFLSKCPQQRKPLLHVGEPLSCLMYFSLLLLLII